MEKLKSLVLPSVKYIDLLTSQVILSFKQELPGVICLLFHSLLPTYQSTSRLTELPLDPQQFTSPHHLEKVITYFLTHNYQFTTPQQLRGDPSANKKQCIITFDDGYYNNIRALPILEKYAVPATFYVSTDHIKNQKCYWWDVLFRERIKQGYKLHEIRKEQESLKLFQTNRIEEQLEREFGSDCLTPISDLDRPMSINELKEFSTHKHVYLGNHTANHDLLTNYTSSEIERQIQQCQSDIEAWTGQSPSTIAYPDGRFSNEIIEICRQLGFETGITTFQGKNYYQSMNMLALKRYTLWGTKKIERQCASFRSDYSLISYLKTFTNLYAKP